jgi:hypothetical protein
MFDGQMPQTPRTIDYNHRAFISSAESYGVAAFHLAQSGPHLAHPAPIGTLACHCMELSLKAVLLKRGAGPEDLRRHGHDLRKLLTASQLPWSDLDTDAVAFFADALREHAFRYIDMNRYYVLGEGIEALSTCETVFHRCLAVAMPGARRTLRR